MRNRAGSIITLVACCIAMLPSGGLIFGLPGIVGEYWQKAFHAGKADVGLILFYVLAGAGVMMFIAGRVQEKIHPKILMMTGSGLCAGGVFYVSGASGMTDVYIWAFTTGAASAMVYLPGITVVQIWHSKRRGMAAGLVSMFFGVSGAVMSPIFNRMFGAVGYNAMMIRLGVGALVLGFAASVLVSLPETAPSDSGRQDQPEAPSMTVMQSLRSASFWLLWFTYAFAGAAGVAMVPLSIPYGLSKGLDMGDAIVILMAFNMTNGVSRFASGFLSDLIGRKNTMCAAFVLAGGAYFLLPLPESVFAISALAAVIGFAFGALFSVSAPLVSECFGMAHFGAIFGLIFTAYGFTAGILGPWTGGHILDVTGDFRIVFLYLGSLMIASSVMIWFITPGSECGL